jgi:acetoin utilization protein AcuB
MNIKVKDLMVQSVITTMPHKSVGHAQKIMTENNIKSIPVVDGDLNLLGIITATDMLQDISEATPLRNVMTTKVYTIPAYSDVHIAARVMTEI